MAWEFSLRVVTCHLTVGYEYLGYLPKMEQGLMSKIGQLARGPQVPPEPTP